jgi:polar amino acid transport system substrate-binding protein
MFARDFTIGVDTWVPFIFVNQNKFSGISIDYIRELTKRMNVNLVIKPIPWARSLKMLKYGQIDAVINMVETKERKEYITFTNPPYIELTTRFYIRKNGKDLIKNYEDLYKYQIGTVRGSAYFEPFNSDTKINKYGVTSEPQLLAMLAKDRFRVIIGTDPQVDYEIAQKGYKDIITKASYNPKNLVQIRVGISKKSSFIKDLDSINDYTKEIIEEGLIDKYRQKYL